MSTISQESPPETRPVVGPPDWNQGWQDAVIGLALSFAFIEAITLAILLENRPESTTPITALALVAKILSLVLPLVLGYGTYAAFAMWTYRAQQRMLAAGQRGGVVYGRPVVSPYRLGSVLIFWVTIFGMFAATIVVTLGKTHDLLVAAAILRLAIGIACAWIAAFVRRDIELLMGPATVDPTEGDNPEEVDVPAS